MERKVSAVAFLTGVYGGKDLWNGTGIGFELEVRVSELWMLRVVSQQRKKM